MIHPSLHRSDRRVVSGRGRRNLLASFLALAAAAGGALAAVASIGSAQRQATVERRLYLMGTEATLWVTSGERAGALAAAERAVRALEETEARLSTWRPDSELSRLNRAPLGSAVTLSPALAAELAAARDCADATGGAFDPGVGSLVDAWDLRGRGRLPEPAELATALASSGVGGVELRGNRATRRRAVRIEEGAWGKGAGIENALRALAANPRVRAAWLDLGGQTAVLGGARWTTTLADPVARDRAVAELDLAGGSVSTSGNGERGLEVEGRRIGHLLDPRTGLPAPDFGSLTVWAGRGLLADCLSTALFVMGPEGSLDWVAAHPGVEVVVLERAGDRLRLRASAGLAGRVRALVPDLTMSFEATPGALAASRTNEEAAGRSAWQRGPAAP